MSKKCPKKCPKLWSKLSTQSRSVVKAYIDTKAQKREIG